MLPRTTLPRFEFRSILIFVGSIALLVVISVYVLFQARFMIAGPQIVLINEAPIHNNARVVKLEGTAFNITHLWLNDRPIFTDEAGHFTEALVLENGYTVATLRAKDRYGRETRVERSFVYTPASFSKN
jgi:hypothetical protein